MVIRARADEDDGRDTRRTTLRGCPHASCKATKEGVTAWGASSRPRFPSSSGILALLLTDHFAQQKGYCRRKKIDPTPLHPGIMAPDPVGA